MLDKHSYITESIISAYSQRRLSFPIPVKLFVGIILSKQVDINELKEELVKNFGSLEIDTPLYPFNHTDYYNKEMGNNLRRCFLGFNRCVQADELAKIKLTTNHMELKMGLFDGKQISRLINLDPGILSLSNVVLATTKNRAHRIYLGKGIYAEITLLYSKSIGWYPLEWTYPDYRTPIAKGFFQKLRQIYYQGIKT